MPQQDSSRDIDNAAARWAARIDRGTLSSAETAELIAWQAGDPRAKGALLRAQAMLGAGDPVGALRPLVMQSRGEKVARRLLSKLSRRGLFAAVGGGAGIAAIAAVTISVPAGGTTVATARGEIRLVPLPDGSTVVLNTSSRIRIQYDNRRRRVAMLDGEAFFSVTADANRPFEVEAGGRRLVATTAQFQVSTFQNAPTDVMVHQGRVQVLVDGLAPATALGANTQILLSGLASTERVRKIAPEAATRALAWRDGQLAFEGETLGQAATAFARYSDTRLDIADAALAREPVSGLFAANDPVGFARAVAVGFDARVERTAQGLRLTRATPKR